MNRTPATLTRWTWIACALPLALGCAGTQTPDDPTPVEAGQTDSGAAGPAFADVAEPEDAPVDADTNEVASTIEEVTVYSDRAQVMRKATIDVTTEPQVFAIEGLPGWVDDGSVRVSVSAGRIVDVRVQRDYLAEADDVAYKAAEEEHRELQDAVAALNDELAVLQAKKQQIESIKAFSTEKITQDTQLGDIKVKSYGEVLDFITDSLRKTAASRRQVEIDRRALQPELQASSRRLNELKSLTQLEETSVMVTLQASQPVTSAVELKYMLPGATWEPMHELRVRTSDAGTAEVTSYAVVTQTSGEDWNNAQLFFSTQSSTEAVRIPELDALTLGDTTSTQTVVTSKVSSFTRAQKAYENQNRLWNQVQRSGKRQSERVQKVYESNLESFQVIQNKTVRLFEKLQKRGTTVQFAGQNTPTIRGDGRPVRLRIGQTNLKASQRIVAAPEESLNAARTLEMTNSSDQPFLPGKVALYQDGTFLGMTEVDFIAEGERFSLFSSIADHIKITRKLDKKQSSLVRKKRTRMKVAFIVTVENLSDQPTSLTLADRIPVSENRDIRVERVRITPAAKPDSRGLLSWDVSLEPQERRVFKISYEVEYPPTLILETRRKQRAAPAAAPRRSSPYKRKRKQDIGEQLMDLEQNF